MPVELSGQQIQIRIREPELFSEIKTADPGEEGRLQLIVGKLKKSGNWTLQAYRINLNDYSNVNEVINEIKKLKTITGSQKADAIKIANNYFK
jgi:hypothetical protein